MPVRDSRSWSISQPFCNRSGFVTRESADIQWRAAVKESGSAAEDDAALLPNRNRKTRAGRKIHLVEDTVSIQPKAQINSEAIVYPPAILRKYGKIRAPYALRTRCGESDTGGSFSHAIIDFYWMASALVIQTGMQHIEADFK
jgi:hypothetical protein